MGLEGGKMMETCNYQVFELISVDRRSKTSQSWQNLLFHGYFSRYIEYLLCFEF